MSTIKMHVTTVVTPEKYTAALTDFGRDDRRSSATLPTERRLMNAFRNRVKAVEARDNPAPVSQP